MQADRHRHRETADAARGLLKLSLLAGGDVKLEARVAGFLVFHENRDFCDACLAAKLGATAADVQAAVASLRRRSAVVLRDRWACQLCGKKGEVTRALAGRTVAMKSQIRRRASRVA